MLQDLQTRLTDDTGLYTPVKRDEGPSMFQHFANIVAMTSLATAAVVLGYFKMEKDNRSAAFYLDDEPSKIVQHDTPPTLGTATVHVME